MKMAVQVWHNRGEDNRNRFIFFRHAYHGDTMGAMSVCDPDEGMHALFRGYFPDQIMAEIPRSAEERATFEALLAQQADTYAAVIV